MRRLYRQQAIGIARDRRPVDLGVMVSDALLLAHDRIKRFGVKVAIVDLVAAYAQRADDLLMQCRPEARGGWICVQNKNAQRRTPSVSAGSERSVPSGNCNCCLRAHQVPT